jgi:hypothetical protein
VNKNNDTFTRASLKKKTMQGNNNNQKAAAVAVAVTVTGRLFTAAAQNKTNARATRNLLPAKV